MYPVVQERLLRDLALASQLTRRHLHSVLQQYGICGPCQGQSKQHSLSQLARKSNMSLPEFVRLVRGETKDDTRPNKALSPATYRRLLQGYEHLELMVQIALHGFRAEWLGSFLPSKPPPPNHRSADQHAEGIAAKIREGEMAGTYLVIDVHLLTEWHVVISPFGAVPKAAARDASAIRLIHDLAFPARESVNSYTVQESLSAVKYQYVSALAERIEVLALVFPGVRILLLKGDVQGAFRHLRQHADDVHWMGGRIRQGKAGVVDLSAPFGWTGSPAFYSVFGRAISTIVERESPATMRPGHHDMDPFFAYEWVDDHVMVEPDLNERCAIAEDTLRLAMLAVLGPLAINESKFTVWDTKLRALGLDWDSAARTVTMPPEKIAKALQRIHAAVSSVRISARDLQKLLGSLRHVATCLRAARPFYQRLQALCIAVPTHGSTIISSWVADDLHWFSSILRSGALEGVPTRLFGSLPQPDVHVYMDASSKGLCVLDPGSERYLTLTFDVDEVTNRAFDINIREQFAVALACLIFGPSWHSTHAPQWPHIRCWSDNMTTVSRTNRLSARHPLAQELNRSIGFAEATWRLRVTTEHLPGASNVVADAGSRLNQPTHREVFTNAVCSWSQVPVPSHLRRIYTTFSSTYRPRHWPQAPEDSTIERGISGATGVATGTNPAASRDNRIDNPSSSLSSPLPAGSVNRPPSPTRRLPCCPSAATYRGIIKSATGTPSDSPRDIALLCLGCAGCQHHHNVENQSPSSSSSNSTGTLISNHPATALRGGLLSWATFSCCEGQSISEPRDQHHGSSSAAATSPSLIIRAKEQTARARCTA